MHFVIIGELADLETISQGAGIRERARLVKRYGRGRWRKRKGFADIRLGSGYEATGIGKREFKIKRLL